MPRAGTPAPLPDPTPPAGAPPSALGEWLRRQRNHHFPSTGPLPIRILAAVLAAAALLGVGTWIGLSNAAKPKAGPASLVAALQAAQAGQLPCGPSAQLPGVLSQICGGPNLRPKPTNPKRSGAGSGLPAGQAELARFFGGPVQVGVVTANTPSGLQFQSGSVTRDVTLAGTVAVLQVRHPGGVLTLTPLAESALTAGTHVLVVLSRPVTSPATAVAIYLLPYAAHPLAPAA